MILPDTESLRRIISIIFPIFCLCRILVSPQTNHKVFIVDVIVESSCAWAAFVGRCEMQWFSCYVVTLHLSTCCKVIRSITSCCSGSGVSSVTSAKAMSSIE